MRVKQLLKQCRHEKREILILTQKRDMIRMSLLPSSNSIKPVVVQSSRDPDSMGKKEAIIEQLDKEIDRQLAKMLEHDLEAHKLVGKLEDSIQRQVIELYYLSFREDRHKNKHMYIWEEVADELGYSISTVFDYADAAMKEMEKCVR